MNEQDKGSVGSSVGIVIVILILVLGGIYFFNQSVEKANNGTESAEVNSLESDSSSMNFDGLGEGVDQLQ